MGYFKKDEGNNRLPFPTEMIGDPYNPIEVYVIPEDKKEDVLKKLYPFVGVPALDEERIDLHTGNKFMVKDFMVTRESKMDFLVSPYYLEGGGSVIDWVPVDEYENSEDYDDFDSEDDDYFDDDFDEDEDYEEDFDEDFDVDFDDDER